MRTDKARGFAGKARKTRRDYVENDLAAQTADDCGGAGRFMALDVRVPSPVSLKGDSREA